VKLGPDSKNGKTRNLLYTIEQSVQTPRRWRGNSTFLVAPKNFLGKQNACPLPAIPVFLQQYAISNGRSQMLVITGVFENERFIPDRPVSIPQKKKVTITIDDELPADSRKTARRAIFDKCRLNLTDFKFNRDEANNYG
jgi:hypothetical protein